MAEKSGEAKGRRPNKYVCSTPPASCSGSDCMDIETTKAKFHDSQEQALRCEQRYMVKLGYTRVAPRDFAPPDGGPIVVLSKRSSHVRVKPGKTEGGYMAMNLKVRNRLPDPSLPKAKP